MLCRLQGRERPAGRAVPAFGAGAEQRQALIAQLVQEEAAAQAALESLKQVGAKVCWCDIFASSMLVPVFV